MDTTRGEVITAAYAHVAGLLFDTPLAMQRDRAVQLASYLTARMRGAKPEAAISLNDMQADPITLEMRPGGVAVLGIAGTMTPKGSNMDALSGLVGYDALRASFDALAADPKVRGVVVAMDSPGGSVLGVDAAGAAMAALAAAKPVYLVADHLTASAAYWIGSQATKLFVSETSLVGAIGSFIVRRDSTKADAQAGEEFTFVADMARKGDGDPHKALSPDELAAMEATVRHADGLFFAAVSKARGLSVKAIKQLNGDVLMGRAAIDAGLADEVGTVADAVAALTATLSPKTTRSAAVAAEDKGGSRMSAEDTGGALSATVTDITTHPDFQKAVDAAAGKQSAEALERDREIRGLCALFELDAKRTEELVASNQSRADIYAALQAAKVTTDAETDVRGTHGGSASGGGSRRETQDTAAAVQAEYADRRKIHAEARTAFFGRGA